MISADPGPTTVSCPTSPSSVHPTAAPLSPPSVICCPLPALFVLTVSPTGRYQWLSWLNTNSDIAANSTAIASAVAPYHPGLIGRSCGPAFPCELAVPSPDALPAADAVTAGRSAGVVSLSGTGLGDCLRRD